MYDKTLLIERFQQNPNIPWGDVIGMRNKIAHHYFNIDTEIVFDILRFDIPPLLDTIRQIIIDLK